MGRMVALLRGVNVGGRKLPMAELRALCAELGWEDVATYIQSGNVVFAAEGRPAGAGGGAGKGDRETVRHEGAGHRPHRGAVARISAGESLPGRRPRQRPTGFC